jgi:hypothetical protein
VEGFGKAEADSGRARTLEDADSGSDLLKDLRASVAAQTGIENSSRVSNHGRVQHPAKASKTKAARKL